ncbi:MAG TPA: DUF5107 domain-containing protein [Anaerolineae bacterium]|nr:DUF5107 domain-containing protein [Anaerolineae bacterium]
MKSADDVSRTDSGSWLETGVRLLLTLVAVSLLASLGYCSPRGGLDTPVATSALARLHVDVGPSGARVLVDGLRSGTTPLSLDLPAGPHTVRVELEGYEPLERTVGLLPGESFTLDEDLLAVATPIPDATPRAGAFIPTIPNDGLPLPDLLVRGVVTTLETGGDCDYTSTQLGSRVTIANEGEAPSGPFILELNGVRFPVTATVPAGDTISPWFPNYAYGSETRIVLDVDDEVEESNEENNVFQAMVPIPTLPPTCTPGDDPTLTPTATPTPTPASSSVVVRESQVTISTYPYAGFLTMAHNAQYNISYPVLDRAAYDASGPTPSDATYQTLVVENEYLKLTFLPELGGRLYEIVYKPTGHRETYRNPVLKPSPWGPPEQGWWLAAGGIEWCLPVEEHGYQWGVPWQIETQTDANSATVLLRDSTAADRVRTVIAVRLEAGASSFTIRPRIENPTSAALPVKYWTNAMLAPGAGNAPSADLRFQLAEPIESVTVHSRGDDNLPPAGARMDWPVANGTDYSRLGNWNRWLGFFEDPAAGDWMAVYDEQADEGVVRAFQSAQVPGAKMFAFGWADPIPASNWTDDGSSYVEMHGGAAPTFDTSVTIPPGGHIEWTETWYPVAGLGGLRHANSFIALNLTAANRQARVAVATTRRWTGTIALSLDGEERWRQQVSLVPGRVFLNDVPLDGDVPAVGRLSLTLESEKGGRTAEYHASYSLQ